MSYIPKIVHYCWFGGSKMPEPLLKCIKTWDILKSNGYEIIEWNEKNCSFDENDFVKKCYKEKKWGFIGDYYRAKVIYEYGGIYLDTDVIVKKVFDDLLYNNAFIGFANKYMICTAVAGGEKHSKYFEGILDMYNNGEFFDFDVVVNNKPPRNFYENDEWIPSNCLWGWYTIKNNPNIKFINKIQKFNNVTIYPYSYFECGSLFYEYYSRHLNTNMWKNKKKSYNPLRVLKRFFDNFEITWIINRHIIIKFRNKDYLFYKYKPELKASK